jgi:hypothetical protein
VDPPIAIVVVVIVIATAVSRSSTPVCGDDYHGLEVIPGLLACSFFVAGFFDRRQSTFSPPKKVHGGTDALPVSFVVGPSKNTRVTFRRALSAA